jgi:hypothetical protein
VDDPKQRQPDIQLAMDAPWWSPRYRGKWVALAEDENDRPRSCRNRQGSDVGGLGGPAFMTSAGFMSDFSKGGYGLLGRKGFFNEFTFVKFQGR